MKKYVLFAGVNGAGKTTLYSFAPSVKGMDIINLDDMVRKYGDWTDSAAILAAGKEAVRRVAENISYGVSFCQETTLCGKSVLRNIVGAKQSGYSIEMHYIGLENAEIAKQRVKNRVSHGGHGIPERDIERRYYESLENMAKILPLCNRAVLYDNSRYLQRVAVFENGNCIKKFSVIPKWFSFLTNNS